MWQLLFLIGIAASVMTCGVLPVIYRIKGENNPSPWSYSMNETVNEGVTIDDAATQSSVNVSTPTIPEFAFSEETVNAEQQVSIPDAEVWENVEKLLSETIEQPVLEVEPLENNIPIFNEKSEAELTNQEEVTVPNLTNSQYQAIRQNYGDSVASLITCTPYQGCLGEQVMIGIFHEEGNRLEFDKNWVELTSEFKEKLDGEVIVVKGNFLADGRFFVQHWEDPMMIEAGYSTMDNPICLVQ